MGTTCNRNLQLNCMHVSFLSTVSNHLPFIEYTRYQFIRNVAKLQLVPFLIFVWIFTSLCFLNFQKYIVTVSYILPNFRTSFAFFIGWLMKGCVTLKNHLSPMKIIEYNQNQCISYRKKYIIHVFWLKFSFIVS